MLCMTVISAANNTQDNIKKADNNIKKTETNNKQIIYANSKGNKSSGEFYIYNTNDETIMTFNEYTILPKKERKNIYEILEKLSNEVNLFDKNYILNVIKNNKKNISNKISKNSENYNVDRTKRIKINIFN